MYVISWCCYSAKETIRMKPKSPPRRGFTLIMTISLMVLLTMIVVGLLSLSSVSLRSSSQAMDQAAARANARFSLMLAIGELQKSTGLDTRVTARADVLNANNPPIMGAWKSWEGTDHETSGAFVGRPVAPSNYKTAKETRFVRWMVSGEFKTQATLPNTTKATGKATLIGDRSVGSDAAQIPQQVHLTPVPITLASQKGAYAWWVGGENQKARLPRAAPPETDSSSGWAAFVKSHAVADTKPFLLDPLIDDTVSAQKAVNLKQVDLISTATSGLQNSQKFFHDLSTVSTGLLTNTATGGWRKDLSLFTENYSNLPSSGLALFRNKPDTDILCTIPAGSDAIAPNSMLYSWASYRGGNTIPIYQHGPVTSWENLADYATLYKRMTVGSGGRMSIPATSFAIDDAGNSYNYLHKVRILPVIARIQWVMSHWAGTPPPPAAGQPANPPGSLQPRLLCTPIITMWNPYSVEISSPAGLSFGIPTPLPVALKYTVGGINCDYRCLTASSGDSNYAGKSMVSAGSYSYSIPDVFTLNPGETRVFSPLSTTPVAAGTSIRLSPGYRSGGGHFFPVKDDAGNALVVAGTATIKADAKFNVTYNDRSIGVGIYLDMGINGRRHLVYRMCYPLAVAENVYKPLTNMASSSLNQALTSPTPFLSTMFGARMASNTHIAAKGFIQSSPLVNYTAMGGKDVVESTIARHYGGTNHPVNSPFDYSFVKHAPGGDSWLPNASDASGRGYIVTGFNKSDGLSRCVAAELPTRPLSSLGELQNWDLRYENPIPPYSFNIIGNSDASPLMPSNAVINSNDSSLTENLQYDDSYCANHILFDDWFFSSIAPSPTTFGASGKSLQANYISFITGAVPLANRAYRPIAADSSFATISTTNANTLFTRNVNNSNAWRNIASRFEVEGMFNVNSTSVTAWRALLGHARNQKVPFISEAPGTWSVTTSAKMDYPFSRFSINGDAEAKAIGNAGAFPDCAEFAGYRRFSEQQLDALAKKIVDQIRLRGPFLSLSEFINRQLSSGNLALAGTIQSALNEIALSASTNPYGVIQALSKDSTPALASAADAEYKFAAAATGESAYGLPGWTRQADVLRPIAPILSARDDTFTIRGYGEARDASNAVKARAVCEAVVRRTRNYIDSRELADLATPPVRPLNKAFGRRYELISFRWLAPTEI